MSRVTAGLPDLDDPHPLDADTIDAFRRDGHVAVRGLATPEEVAAYLPAIAEAVEAYAWDRRPLEERDTYGKAFLQAANLWRRSDVVARFVLAARFARVAAELLGADGVRLYHDQGLFKEPGGGGTPWHQDQYYWPLDNDRTVTMWMALEDIRPPQSGMTFANGSHRLGDLRGPGISDASEEEFARHVAERSLTLHAYETLDAGDATFHAGWILHRAGANPTGRMRPAMTVIYVADGTRVAEPSSPAQELDLKLWLRGHQPGDLVGGERNPRLWPPDNTAPGRALAR